MKRLILTIMNTVQIKLFVSVILVLGITGVRAQTRSHSESPAYQHYFDSLKAMEYNYKLPFLGKKAYANGFDLAYAWGFSGVYFTQRQEISIDRILLGYNNSEMADFSDFINFGPTIATTNAYTVRPDVWLWPFLNVYGIFGIGTTETAVTLLEPISLQTTQKFTVSSLGVGVTLAGALGPLFIAWDNNYNYATVPVVVEPVPAFNSSLRIGHNVMFPDRPDRTLAVWVGAFYQAIQNDTEGSIGLQEIFPEAGSGNTVADLREWATSLPPGQRVIANQIIDQLEEAGSNLDEEDKINYLLDKRVSAPFNIILGAQ